MRSITSLFVTKIQHWVGARSPRRAGKTLRTTIVRCASNLMPLLLPVNALAGPSVEFDVAPTAECRDITPTERIKQYPNQRLIEVTLPVSVRFRGVSMDEVDELAIEVNGASAGMRVHDFAPATQLFTDVSHEIETTTTTKKARSLDGSLGGTIPIPGADAVAHLTPTISAGIAGCNTETEKSSRLPPKNAVVVSGTSSAGQGVFFKLKRYSQTSLEGSHELTVTFVAPRTWRWSEIRVDCAARGEQKVLWMKQSGTIGQTTRLVQLVEMSAKPVRQVVLKPVASDQTAAKIPPTIAKAPVSPETNPAATTATSAAIAAGQWRAPLHKLATSKATVLLDDEAAVKATNPTAAPAVSAPATVDD
jgi:hypothetical protein